MSVQQPSQPATIRAAAVGGTRGAHLIQNWQRWGLADAVAFCDLNVSLVEAEADATEREGFARPRAFADLDEMLDWGGFDCVVVATGDATHHAVASRILERGIPCLVEKPMTTNLEDACDLVRLCRAKNTIGMVGHEFRHVPAIQQAKSRIEGGLIGTPRIAITLDYCGRMGCYWRRSRWRKSNRTPDMSLTLQKAIHQLDVQGYLMGSAPTKVYASAGEDHFGNNNPSGLRGEGKEIDENSPYHPSKPLYINGIRNDKAKQDNLPVFTDDTDLHDNQAVVIDYASGARGTYVECFFTPDYRVEHTIIGDRGRMVLRAYIGSPFMELEISPMVSTETRIERIPGLGSHSGGDHGLAKAFIEAVRTGVSVQPTLVDGAYAVALCKAIDASAETGQPVQVPCVER
jgi:predicted dehydrogenase